MRENLACTVNELTEINDVEKSRRPTWMDQDENHF